ncbi:MAG: hypothetical protein AAF517_22695 [Planctomycetota bacterium]
MNKRRTILGLGLFCIALLGVTAVVQRARLLEEWYIYRLRSGDEAISDRAALELAVIGKTRAVSALIARVPHEISQGRVFETIGSPLGPNIQNSVGTNSAVFKALHSLRDIGSGQLQRAIRESPPDVATTLEAIVSIDDLIYLATLGFAPRN